MALYRALAIAMIGLSSITAIQAQPSIEWRLIRSRDFDGGTRRHQFLGLAGSSTGMVALSRIDDATANTAMTSLERSTSRGDSWDPITPPGLPMSERAFVNFPMLRAITNPTKNTIVAVGDSGTVARSVDGGANWTMHQIHLGMPGAPQAVARWFVGVHFSDEQHGAIIAGTHYVLRTDNGGETWRTDTLWGSGGRIATLAGVFRAVDGSTIVADEANTIWRIPENGPARMDTPFVQNVDRWDGPIRFAAAGNSLWCTAFRTPPNGENDWANTALVQSDDNGKSWTTRNYEIFPSMRFGARFLSFSDPYNGMMVGLYGTDSDSTLHTTDGGASWHTRPFPTRQFGLFSPAGLVMLSSTDAVAVSVAGDMVRWDPNPHALGSAPEEPQVQRLTVLQSNGGTIVRVGRIDECPATKARLRLYDLCGKLVGDFSETLDHASAGGNVTSFELPPLPSGAYVLQLDMCREIETRTFVVTR